MDKAQILRDCTRIEEIVTDAYNQHRGLNYYELKEVKKKIKDIGSEVSEQPKTNADRIRQMTVEELAEWLTDGHEQCDFCAQHLCDFDSDCVQGVLKWLKQEVNEDATD